MSKNSPKALYEQLTNWLTTLQQSKTNKEQSSSNFSKTDYYKTQREYGKRSN